MSGPGRLFHEFMAGPEGAPPLSLPMPHRMVVVTDRATCVCGAVLPWQDHATDRQSPAFFRFAWCMPCLRGYLYSADVAGYEAFVRATAPMFDNEDG